MYRKVLTLKRKHVHLLALSLGLLDVLLTALTAAAARDLDGLEAAAIAGAAALRERLLAALAQHVSALVVAFPCLLSPRQHFCRC